MKNLFIACIALAFSGAAFAGSTSAYCGAVTPAQDGIGCKVAYIDGLGDTLLIKLHTKKTDNAARIAKAKAATQRAIDTFLAEGGVFIKMRTTRADGTEVERTCSKVKGKKTEHCGEWAAVKG